MSSVELVERDARRRVLPASAEKYSRRLRLLIIVGSTLTLWALAIGGVWSLVARL